MDHTLSPLLAGLCPTIEYNQGSNQNYLWTFPCLYLYFGPTVSLENNNNHSQFSLPLKLPHLMQPAILNKIFGKSTNTHGLKSDLFQNVKYIIKVTHETIIHFMFY